MSTPCNPACVIPLTPAVFHILLALAGGERHGYRIMQEVERVTAGQFPLGAATLYRSIQKMLIDGFIDELHDPLDSAGGDERRRYYKLTAFGRRVAQAEARRLATLVQASRQSGLLRPDSPAVSRSRR